MQIKALLFDLDGTLVDSALDLANTVNQLRQHLGLEALKQTTALSYVGDGATKLVQRALNTEVVQPQHLQLFLQLYADNLLKHSDCYPGVREFVAHHQHKSPATAMAVVSNKPHHLAVALLRGLDFLSPFRLVIGGDSLAHKKPHPLPILHTLKQLQVEPKNCVMIGDHATDLLSAKAAGCASCFCHYGFGDAAGNQSTWSVNHATELLALFP
ncbi:MAG: HAD-IA family hydrolase [Desulfuromonas sp.]|nr:HAD-IA family hydrolase [Desulfuromonas sp.]